MHVNCWQLLLQARGLLASDATWIETMEEVSRELTGSQLRRFFVTLLLNCVVENPAAIFEHFREVLGDDYKGENNDYRDRRSLYHIHKLLAHRNRSLDEFGLQRFYTEEEIADMAQTFDRAEFDTRTPSVMKC